MKKIIMGSALIFLFCFYAKEISVADNKLSSYLIVLGRRVSCDQVIDSGEILDVRTSYGYRRTPLVSVLLQNGETRVIAELWRPLYNEDEICGLLKEALQDKGATIRILPLWWALLIGIVLIGVGLADCFGLIRVVECGKIAQSSSHV